MNDQSEEAAVERNEDQTENTDNVGETSVEINVEELIAQIKAEQEEAKPAKSKLDARRQLEDMIERQRSWEAIQDFDEYELD